MQSGFNTNYRYRGVLFHVQTEDSGVGKPHVITHLFHGGNILASQKLDYSEKLGCENLEEVVRGFMETQHKAMLQALRDGKRDAVILERLGADALDGVGDGPGAGPTGPDETDTASGLERIPEREPRAPAAAPKRAAPAPARARPASRDTPKDRLNRAFGEGIVSQKPLDEVVLEYLVENARKRKRKAQ